MASASVTPEHAGNRCPFCGQPALSAWRKLTLGPARSLPCRACGRRVGVAFWPAAAVLAPAVLFVALARRIAEHGYGLLVAAAVLVLLWVFVGYARCVPLRKRSIGPS